MNIQIYNDALRLGRALSLLVKKLQRSKEIRTQHRFFSRDKISGEEVQCVDYIINSCELTTVLQPCRQSDGLSYPSVLCQFQMDRLLYSKYSTECSYSVPSPSAATFFVERIEVPDYKYLMQTKKEYLFQKSLVFTDDQLFSSILFSYLRDRNIPSFNVYWSYLAMFFREMEIGDTEVLNVVEKYILMHTNGVKE